MALQKLITYDSGFTCEYWRIVAIFHDVDKNVATVEVAVYKDEATRLLGRSRFYTSMSFQMTGAAALYILGNPPLPAAYAKLKELADFSGALDV